MLFHRIGFIVVVVYLLGMVSCVSSKKIIYLNDLADTTKGGLQNAQNVFETPIQKNDLLTIAVGGSNAEDLIALNSGSGAIPGASSVGSASKGIGYLVEADGKIQFPFLGRVQAEGLTRVQLEDTLSKRLKDYTKDPVVNVKFMNYGYTVLGEVSHPGRFEMENERTTILDALGMAGDLTILGKRNDILVVREVDGKRQFGRMDLLSKNIFKSPYFYLKTNDVVYVEPVRSKFIARTGIPQYLGLIAAAFTLFLTILNFSK
ncbi:MAG: polysaccharide biosynthesis/export family protein [Ginsengibacter sp.]